MTNSQIFKSKFPKFIGAVDAYKYDHYGDTNEIINFISVPGNYVNYTYYFTASCGCCSDSDTDTECLAHVLDDMSDNEFKELCEDVAKLI